MQPNRSNLINQRPPGNQANQAERESLRVAQLTPLQPLRVLSPAGPEIIPPEKVSAAVVGWKASGLTSVPPEWSSPFFVILASCISGSGANGPILTAIQTTMEQIGIPRDKRVMVRSSGIAETIRTRGGLVSRACSANDVASTISDLHRKLSISPEPVHWIIQQAIDSKAKGQLSNERHLSRENRDWIAEFEPHGDRPGYAARIAVRRWRDGSALEIEKLSCSSEPEITLRLKDVARWAVQFASRIHFEWVWDGSAVIIVQADLAEQRHGIDPRSLVAVNVPAVNLNSLRHLRVADDSDYASYSKLSNARLYRQLGYAMPVFYVTDDQRLFGDLLSGTLPPNFEQDLQELTRRPLIIRTDGSDIPASKREMLPRSDELRSPTEAKQWLLKDFSSRIHEAGLGRNQLCLLAHHFIPSVASAWARAEPGNRIVRIESLWGIPEGLYWYSHDTFEVDTQTSQLGASWLVAPPGYTFRGRIRYKGTFVSPDSAGKWGPVQTAPPHDWRRSIRKTKWLFEIAHTTRRIAEEEKFPVSVMWLIGNHPGATTHEVLPWFHSRSELAGSPKAAPRHKLTAAGDYLIGTVAEWNRLQLDLQAGRRIERIVVQPFDSQLIRNAKFAEDLARLAASRRIVVELAGGILSHMYYILQRHGAQVECVDLFGIDEDVVEYNKIVRDKIPAVIAERGERVEAVQLCGDALLRALREKLVEEALEALDARSGDDLVAELADVEEVVEAICRALQVKDSQLKSTRREKRNRRGGFDRGLMLIKTATPHSIQTPSADTPASLELSATPAIISDPAGVPSREFYYRPDLRHVDQDIEKLLTFEAEATKLGEIRQVLNFPLVLGRGSPRDFTLTVELRRSRASVRGVVRLRTGPEQLELDFSK